MRDCRSMGFRNIAGKYTEMPTQAHKNSESGPTTRRACMGPIYALCIYETVV